MTSSAERGRPGPDARRPAAGALVDVAAVQARLPARAGAAGRVASCCRCSRRCPTRCSPSGWRCSATACWRATGALLLVAAAGLALSAAATWFLRTVSTRGSSAASATRSRSPSSRTWPACRRRWPPSPTRSGPSYLDRLSVLRDQVFVLDHMYMSVFSTAGLDPAARRHRRAAGLDPPGAGRCWPCSPLPTVLTSTWRPAVEREAEERGAPSSRLARHLFTDRHHRPAGQGGAGHRHRRRGWSPQRRAAWERWYGPVAAARWGVGGLAHAWPGRCSAPATSARVVSWPRGCDAPAGDVLLVLAAGVAPVGLHRRHRRRDRLPARHLDGRLAPAGLARGLRRRARRPTPTQPVPDRLRRRHPPSSTCRSPTPAPTGWCSTTSSLDAARRARWWRSSARTAPARRTLVKLLCQALRADRGPDPGRRRPTWPRMPADEWRARLAGAFQDFFRFELRARHSVGVGDVPRLDDEPAVAAAVGRAGADDVVDRLAAGLDTQLGPTWPDGRRGVASASGRSWRWPAASCATSRCCWCSTSPPPPSTPRPSTPCSSATPPAPATRGDDGRITILVSHRFSTVRMADLIVVLDGARVVEVGSHDELHGPRRPVRRALRHPGRRLPRPGARPPARPAPPAEAR